MIHYVDKWDPSQHTKRVPFLPKWRKTSIFFENSFKWTKKRVPYSLKTMIWDPFVILTG